MRLTILFTWLFSFHCLACDGGMSFTKTSKSIPENSPLANDMTEAEFRTSLKNFEKFFGSIIDRDLNVELIVIGSWGSNTVNAFAEQNPGKYLITLYGGLARHKDMTRDGLTASLCHELGHHQGGFPKKSTNKWSSAEGQADYYASMKCLRKMWEKEDNLAAIADLSVPETLTKECVKTFETKADVALCQRMGLAGRSVSLMIQDLDHDSLIPKFETPDDLVVRTMNFGHPFSQCRLDTFFQGAICPVEASIDFDDDDETVGSCHTLNGDQRGLRPRCWFASKR